MASQVVVPVSDHSIGAGWAKAGGTGDYYNHVNESDINNPNDSDYIGLTAPANFSNVIFRLDTATDPGAGTADLWMRVVGDGQTLAISLIEFANGTPTSSWTDVGTVFSLSPTAALEWHSVSLSAGDIANVTDWSLIGVRFWRVGNPSGTLTRISEVQLRIGADVITAPGGPHYSESTSEADCEGTLLAPYSQDWETPNLIWSSECLRELPGNGLVFGCDNENTFWTLPSGAIVEDQPRQSLESEAVSDDYWRLTRAPYAVTPGCMRADFDGLDAEVVGPGGVVRYPGKPPAHWTHPTGFIQAENYLRLEIRYYDAQYVGIFLDKRGTGLKHGIKNGGVGPFKYGQGGNIAFGVVLDLGADGTTCTVDSWVNQNVGEDYEASVTITAGGSATEWIIELELPGTEPQAPAPDPVTGIVGYGTTQFAIDELRPTLGDVRQFFIYPDYEPAINPSAPPGRGTDIRRPYLTDTFSPLDYRGNFGKARYSNSHAWCRPTIIVPQVGGTAAATATAACVATVTGGITYSPPPARTYTPAGHSTRLEAVNYMLRGVGEMPINSIETSTTGYAAMAVQILDDTMREVMTRGWHWNTEYQAEYTIQADGSVTLPANVVRAESSRGRHSGYDLVARGRFLYDRSRNSYDLSRLGSLVYLDTILILDWEELPEAARRFIMARAARIFQEVVQGNSERGRVLMYQETQALALLQEHEIDVSNANMLGNELGYRILNRRSNPLPLWGH